MAEQAEERYSLRKRSKIIYVTQFPTTSQSDAEVLEVPEKVPRRVPSSAFPVNNGNDRTKVIRKSPERRLIYSSNKSTGNIVTFQRGGKSVQQGDSKGHERYTRHSPLKRNSRGTKDDGDYEVDVDFLESEDNEEVSDDNTEYVEVTADMPDIFEGNPDAPYNNSYEVEYVRKELRRIFVYDVQGCEYVDSQSGKKMLITYYVLHDLKKAIMKRYEDHDRPQKVLIGLDKGNDKDETVLCTLLFINDNEEICENKFLILAGWRYKEDYGVIFAVLRPVFEIIKGLDLNFFLFFKFSHISRNYGLRFGFECIFCNYLEQKENNDEEGMKKCLDNKHIVFNLPLEKIYIRMFEQRLEVVNKLIRLMEKFLLEDSNTEKFYKILNKKKLYMARSKLKYKFRKYHSIEATEILQLADRLADIRSDIPEVEAIGKMLVLFKSLMKTPGPSPLLADIHKDVHTPSNPCKSCEKMTEYLDEFGRNEMDGYIHVLCHHSKEIKQVDPKLSVAYEAFMEKIQKDFGSAKTKQCCRDGTKKDSMAARYLAVQTFLPDQTKMLNQESTQESSQQNGSEEIDVVDEEQKPLEKVQDADEDVDIEEG